MQLVLDTKGIELGVKDKVFFIQSPSKSRKISPKKVTSIAVTAYCKFTSTAVMLAVDHQIPILFFNYIGKAKAKMWSPFFQNLATLRRRQILFANTLECTVWFLELYKLKTEHYVKNLEWLKLKFKSQAKEIDNSIRLMKRYNKEFDDLESQLLAECRQQLMAIEGKIARRYWSTLGKLLPEPYGFEKRSRRPAKDIFNAALNYLYGMTYTVVEGSLLSAGLDPHLGFVHADQYQKSVLAFDMIEPFRPWIDRLLIEECLEGKLTKKHFTGNQHGLHLNKHGKALIIPMFNLFLTKSRNFLQLETSNKNHIYQYAGYLVKKIKTHEFEQKF